jgi:hypothetical protein
MLRRLLPVLPVSSPLRPHCGHSCLVHASYHQQDGWLPATFPRRCLAHFSVSSLKPAQPLGATYWCSAMKSSNVRLGPSTTGWPLALRRALRQAFSRACASDHSPARYACASQWRASAHSG